MSSENPYPGVGNAAEFQCSALPFVTSSTAPATGSPVRIDLPRVSRFVTISNRDATATNTLSLGFTRSGVVSTNNKFIVLGSQTQTFELRVKELWIQSENGTPAFSLMVGLTNVDSRHMPILTGTLSPGVPGWNGVG